MKTKIALLAGIAGLLASSAAFAGSDSWRRPEPAKPKALCCATCLPGGKCCLLNHSYVPGPGGRGLTRNATVLCKDTCVMPQKERGCCTSGCVH